MEKATTKKKESPAAKDAAAPAPQDAKRRPLKTFTQGDVSASIWARDHLIKGQQTRFYSVTFERSYRDNTGQYRYTASFNPDDLGALMSLCQQCGEYVTAQQYPQPEGPVED